MVGHIHPQPFVEPLNNSNRLIKLNPYCCNDIYSPFFLGAISFFPAGEESLVMKKPLFTFKRVGNVRDEKGEFLEIGCWRVMVMTLI